MDNMNFNSRPENRDSERSSFWQGLGVFALSFLLAAITVLIINI